MGTTSATPETPTFVPNKEVVKLTKDMLIKDKENGLTIPEQAKKYKLPVTQMRKALKIAGVAIKAKSRARQAKFEIVVEA